MKLEMIVNSQEDGKPAYEVLAARFHMSRLLLKRIRLYGTLHVNQIPVRMKDPVYRDDSIVITYEEEREAVSLREDCDIPIRFEDDWLIVCEKPAGLVTHPSWQHMDDSLIQRLSNQRLHPVMRLDRETSGLIVIAKNGYAHNLVAKLPMEKHYLAIVHGRFSPENGRIEAPIGRSPDSIMIREVREDGHPSVTHYQTQSYDEDKDISLVEFILETGRCHQIRVHSRYLGHPLVGDGLYGPRSNDYYDSSFKNIAVDEAIGRQGLHASYLSFIHPLSKEKMTFESHLPADMQALLDS